MYHLRRAFGKYLILLKPLINMIEMKKNLVNFYKQIPSKLTFLLSKKAFFSLIFIILFIKIVVIFSTSYPFDFASYVYQIRQYYNYNIPSIFLWNKGVILLALFHIQYSIYIGIVWFFQLVQDNVLLLHFVYKIPFFFADILIGIYLYRLVALFNRDIFYCRGIFLLWIANPLVFWIVEIQGQYGILGVLFAMASLFYLLKGKHNLSFILLGLGCSVYYYPFIFLPAYILYLYFKHQDFSLKTLGKLGIPISFFLITLVFSFSPYLFKPDYTLSLKNSLLHHSAPDAAVNIKEILLPDFSLFKTPYLLSTGEEPSNLTSPIYFNYISKTTLIGLLIILIYYLVQFYVYVIKRKKTYGTNELLTDCLVLLLTFLVFVAKFQPHYFLWAVPLWLIFLFYKNQIKSVSLIYLVSILVVVTSLAKYNLGIFFLDLVSWGQINFWLNLSTTTISVLRFVCVFILIVLIFFISRDKLKKLSLFRHLNLSMLIAALLFFILVSFFGFKAMLLTTQGHLPVRLSSDKNLMNYYFAPSIAKFNIKTENNKLVKFDGDNFDMMPNLIRNTPGYLANGFPWSVYDLNDQSDYEISIVSEPNANNKYLKIGGLSPEADVQVNFGKSSENYIPVESDILYNISARVNIKGISGKHFYLSVRFLDKDYNILSIANKDIFDIYSNTDGWELFQKSIKIPENVNNIEFLATLRPIENSIDNIYLSTVLLDSIKIQKKETTSELVLNLMPPENIETIEKNIIEEPMSKDFFDFNVYLNKDYSNQEVQYIKLNDCVHDEILDAEELIEEKFIFKTECFNSAHDNLLTVLLKNFDEPPQVRTYLRHKFPEEYFQNNKSNILVVSFILGVILNICLLFYTVKNFNFLKENKKRE
jgi:hypothetical protein